jgi:hypothetical protein
VGVESAVPSLLVDRAGARRLGLGRTVEPGRAVVSRRLTVSAARR